MGKFTRDTLITFVARILELILAIAASIIIARVLGPRGKGIYSLAILLPAFLITIAQFGIGPASVYYTGKKKYTPKEIFGVNIIFSVLIGFFAMIVGLIIILFFGEKTFPAVDKGNLLLALILIPLNILFLFVIDILLGLQKIKQYNLVQIFRSFIFLFFISIFLLGFRFGIKAAIMANILSFVIGFIALFLITQKETNGLYFRLSRNILKDFFSYGSQTYFGNIATFLHLRVDMWMINYFLNPTSVGLYSIAVALAEKIWPISQSAGTALFPRVSSETDEKKLKEFTPLVCRNILFITFLISLVLFIFGRWIIVLLYSKRFLEALLPFQILLIGTLAVSGSRILTNDLVGRGKPVINTYIAIVSAILNIILNGVLIPKFGINGAAFASGISYFFMFFLKAIIYGIISGNKIKDIILIKKSDFKFYENFLWLYIIRHPKFQKYV